MDHSSREEQEDQQESAGLVLPSTEPSSQPDTPQAHSLSSDEDITTTVHPTGSPVQCLVDEDETGQYF